MARLSSYQGHPDREKAWMLSPEKTPVPNFICLQVFSYLASSDYGQSLC